MEANLKRVSTQDPCGIASHSHPAFELLMRWLGLPRTIRESARAKPSPAHRCCSQPPQAKDSKQHSEDVESERRDRLSRCTMDKQQQLREAQGQDKGEGG